MGGRHGREITFHSPMKRAKQPEQTENLEEDLTVLWEGENGDGGDCKGEGN